MRAVVQRVSRATVTIDGIVSGQIARGLLIYAGVAQGDTAEDIHYIANKIRHLRVFPDAEGKMNLDVSQAAGGILLISNFTLLADARHGRRPDCFAAEQPGVAEKRYDELVASLRTMGLSVETGRFQAMMAVEATNDGPINILLDSRKLL